MRSSAVGLVCVAMAFGLAACGGAQSTAQQDPVARGKYLVTTMGCNDCHTPFKMGANGPEPDMARMLSGHPEDIVIESAPSVGPPWMALGSQTFTAWAGPWGISFSANLTPDEETGIGAWDEQVFVSAMRNGKMMGAGRPLLPPMPWRWYGQMTDADLAAMFAYLKSIPPITNHVPEAVLAPPGPETGSPPIGG
jgi:hypothetical protein